MKRVAIYARVSTTNGSQDYQRQINDLMKLIVEHGYTEEQVDVFAEKISGYKAKAERPELNRLMQLIEDNPAYFECIYVTEVSRLGRNPRQTRDTIEILTDKRIPIYIQSIGRSTLDSNGNRDSIMSIILQVLLEFAHSEAEQMKNRSKSGLLKSATDGKAAGSKHQPYGYKKGEDKMLIIDDEEAIIVREMFDLYRKGNGVKIICGILNARGIPTRFNKAYGSQTIKFNIEKQADKIKWSDKTVLDIITNPLYKGQRRYKGQLLKAPAIVSEELFDLCERIRMTKTHRNNLTTYTYLLKDIITCGCCGRNYFAKYKPVDRGDKVYVCSSLLKSGQRCANKGINIMLLETAIYDLLIKSDAVLKYIGETQDIKQELETDIERLVNQIANEEAALPVKHSEKERLLDIFLQSGISSEVFKERDEKIATQILNIDKRLKLFKKELKAKKILLHQQNETGTTRKMLENASTNRTQLRAIFKQLIEKVIINDLNTRYSLATVVIKIDGVVLRSTIKIVIDKVSIRKKHLIYTALKGMENDPVFKENILLVDKEDILQELDYNVAPTDWIKVDSLLEVEPQIQELASQVA